MKSTQSPADVDFVAVLDLADVAHLMAGGELLIDGMRLVILPANDIWRIAQRVRTRINGARRAVKVSTKKEGS